jgi:hypothetical protein
MTTQIEEIKRIMDEHEKATRPYITRLGILTDVLFALLVIAILTIGFAIIWRWILPLI